MRTVVTTLAVMALAIGLPARQATVPAAADLARQVQQHYAGVQDFVADFTLSTAGGFLRQSQDENGGVQMKKPGKMRWEYRSRDKQLFVSDGTTFKTYFPRDKMGSVTPLPQGDQSSAALLFLAGRGDFVRDFTPSVPDTQPAGEWRLNLTPKRPQSDFTSLTLVVDRTTLKLTGLVTTNDQGVVSTFRFTDLHENVGIPDKAFVWDFPPGTHINK